MTVAKSQTPKPIETQAVANNQDASIVTTYADSTDDQRLLTLPLAIAEAFPEWSAGMWAEFQPALTDRAAAAWAKALDTKPQTLLICAAVCFISGFAVLLVVLLAGILMLLSKLAAAGFVAIAMWQWMIGVAKQADTAIMAASKK